jgi:hypothetical protein
MERFTGKNTKALALGELVGVWLEGLCAILLKKSLPARLETRTKESNVHASMKVEKPSCKMKVIDAKLAASADRVFGQGLSKSVSFRTRKMVNYACIG